MSDGSADESWNRSAVYATAEDEVGQRNDPLDDYDDEYEYPSGPHTHSDGEEDIHALVEGSMEVEIEEDDDDDNLDDLDEDVLGEEDEDDEDDDDEDNFEYAHEDILNVLRARLGADTRLNRLAEQLQTPIESVQLDALSQLSSLFLSGAPLSGISRAVVTALVSLLESPTTSPEVLLAATRACSQLADSGLPVAVRMLVDAGIVPTLSVRFADLGYIDVAEQAVSILQRVVAEAPRAVLDGRVLEPCLQYLEFFNWHIQKAILGAVTHVCQAITRGEDVPKARALAPLLVQYAASPNHALAELALAAVCVLISALSRRSPHPAEDLEECMTAWPALILQIRPRSPLLAKTLRALAHLAPHSREDTKSLCELSGLVSDALVDTASTPEQVLNALLHCPKEALSGALKLFVALLPQPGTTFTFSGPYRRPATQEPRFSSDELTVFAPPALRTALRIYGASADSSLRQLALLLVIKLAWFSPPESLASVPELIGFLGGVIAQYDGPLLVLGALDVAYDLARRVPKLVPALTSELSRELPALDPKDESQNAAPRGLVLMTDNLEPVISYMAHQVGSLLMPTETILQDSEALFELVKTIQSDPTAVDEHVLDRIAKVLSNYNPTELVQSGLIDALATLDPHVLAKLHSSDFLALVGAANGALARAERLPVTASSASSTVPTLQQALTRTIHLRLRPKRLVRNGGSETSLTEVSSSPSWSVSVQAVATVEVLANFVRHRLSGGFLGGDALAHALGALQPAQDVKVNLYIDGKQLHSDMSVLGAVYRRQRGEFVLPRTLWTETFDIEYDEKRPSVLGGRIYPAAEESTMHDSQEREQDTEHDDDTGDIGETSQQSPPIEPLEQSEEPESLGEPALGTTEDDSESEDEHEKEILQLRGAQLLRRLAEANEIGNIVQWSAFTNAKLSAKLSRQLEDPLIVVGSVLPQWTFDSVRELPFLYPLRTRRQFVQSTSLGYARSFNRWQSQFEMEDAMPGALGRLTTQKYRISRDRLLQGSIKLLELSKSNPAVVEVEFFEEAGTGLGPTQEFFALASKEFALEKSMWRTVSTSSQEGLYPTSDPPAATIQLFEGLGRLVARSLLDRRILDLRINRGFFVLVLDLPLSPGDLLKIVDPSLARSLKTIEESKNVDDLYLDFTLPGDPEQELIPHGADIAVTKHNQKEYAALVRDKIVGSGVSRQVEAFRQGFRDSIPVAALHAFLPEELSIMCGGAGKEEDWSSATLRDVIRADHGYTDESEPVKLLIEILSDMNSEERRAFLRFLTGSPNLPFGGFRALQPSFTVVLKHPETEGGNPDVYLPSVMTCASYLKLPSYSTKEIMKQRLMVAISEGAGAFPLS